MNDSALEDLTGLIGKQKHEVVHLLNGFVVALVSLAPLREDLLADEEHEVLKISVLGKVHVFLWMLEAELDSVEDWSSHGAN